MKVIKKPLIFEAYQVPPDDELTRALPPKWLIDALVNDTAGLSNVPIGAWIVRDPFGGISTHDQKYFLLRYEPLEQVRPVSKLESLDDRAKKEDIINRRVVLELAKRDADILDYKEDRRIQDEKDCDVKILNDSRESKN